MMMVYFFILQKALWFSIRQIYEKMPEFRTA